MEKLRRNKTGDFKVRTAITASGEQAESSGAFIKLYFIYIVFQGQLLLRDVVVKTTANVGFVRRMEKFLSDPLKLWASTSLRNIFMLATDPTSWISQY